jgi:hypothetical protein
MRCRLLLLCLAVRICAADEKWISFDSGPFQVYTDAPARAGRETLAMLEQLRHVLGQVMGEADLKTESPVRVVLFRNAKEMTAYTSAQDLIEGRNGLMLVLAAGAPPPPNVVAKVVRLLLAGQQRMPAGIEDGLAALFSTLEVNGTHVLLGKAVPAAERTRDWARMHLLATSPEYYGKLRVLLGNLRRGVDPQPAYRNAFGKTAEDIDRETDSYLRAGKFEPVPVSARPLSPERDLTERAVSAGTATLVRADLLTPQSRSLYGSLLKDPDRAADADEGLGLLALRDNQQEAARKYFASAMERGSKSPRAYVEYARLETDPAKSVAALEHAISLNPKLAEPHWLLAQKVSDPRKRIAELHAAASASPREMRYWETLANTYLAVHNYGDAAKAWREAEQAASDDQQRMRMRQARMAIEQQRLDYEAAERKREAEEKERETQRLKAEAVAEVRRLEAKYNQGKTSGQPGEKVVPWWDGPQPTAHARGKLRQADCLGRRIRLVIEAGDGKTIRLLLRNSSQVTITGGGEQSLACGPQKNQTVVVGYFPKADPKTGTAGDVGTIEFQ